MLPKETEDGCGQLETHLLVTHRHFPLFLEALDSLSVIFNHLRFLFDVTGKNRLLLFGINAATRMTSNSTTQRTTEKQNGF
mmetsp:Transcript_8633/g.12716  ORF Transcript_8633/g.12716 Transcript_8633/m.12716 type:complete len:81 (+) Transcript_8633:103-345(+)